MKRTLLLLACLSAPASTVAASDPSPPLTLDALDLSEAARARWRDHILPTADELAWSRIAWLPSFTAGLMAADRDQRPLLLWVMNGHPLGCT